MTDYYEGEVEAWREAGGALGEPFVLPLAPDRLHKANVSGGVPYGVVLPAPAVDVTFVGASETPFVAYLNEVFAHGGFPGAEGTMRDVVRSWGEELRRL